MFSAYAAIRNSDGSATAGRQLIKSGFRPSPAMTVVAQHITAVCTARQFLHHALIMNACHKMLHNGMARAITAIRFHNGSHWGMSTIVSTEMPNQAIPITLRLYPNIFPAGDPVTVLQLPEHSFTADFQLKYRPAMLKTASSALVKLKGFVRCETSSRSAPEKGRTKLLYHLFVPYFITTCHNLLTKLPPPAGTPSLKSGRVQLLDFRILAVLLFKGGRGAKRQREFRKAREFSQHFGSS